ncbi:AraC family transcriptional regulator [Anaerosalibacter massiliensis]|uniref:AraC family transcriptional regulator n=1 Tax=Anaerosalibacter massiliensis TaxID=1347392 RepID=UPI0005B26C56|nr:AraC family transcriptional regulator [Anaerosalibacter massiliensis]
MEWIERLNSVINYIEEHLEDEINYEQLAKIACCSTYHFQRMFSYMANVPLAEYIRRRRMTMAAVDLQNSNEKVIDIALKYGYNSPTAFNRAFKNIHGITPSEAKTKGALIKAFPLISFKITIKEDVEMNYKIEKKDSFKIIGVAQPLYKEIEKNFKIVPQMWQKVATNGTVEKLVSMMNTELKGILGVSACNEEDEWRYYIGVASDKPIDEGFEEYIVPELTWAIFYGEGSMPHSIQELEKRIVAEWLPTSGYEYANGPDIELYLSPDPQNAKFEVWIPVVKKPNN